MRQSVDLLLNPAAEARVVARWHALADAGLPSQAHHRGATNRPHVTLCAVPEVSPEQERALALRCRSMPVLATTLGGPVTLGDDPCTLVLPVEETPDLAGLRADVAAALGDLSPWRPHVTLARRLPRRQLADALTALGRPDVVRVELGPVRRWDPVGRRAWLLV